MLRDKLRERQVAEAASDGHPSSGWRIIGRGSGKLNVAVRVVGVLFAHKGHTGGSFDPI